MDNSNLDSETTETEVRRRVERHIKAREALTGVCE